MALRSIPHSSFAEVVGMEGGRVTGGSHDQLVDAFLVYRRVLRNTSERTIRAYAADLAQLSDFIGISPIANVDLSILRQFLASLQPHSYARSTIARKIAAIRA